MLVKGGPGQKGTVDAETSLTYRNFESLKRRQTKTLIDQYVNLDEQSFITLDQTTY